MSTTPTPRQIIKTLFPHLKVAAAYARQIQPRIAVLPAKEKGDNFFSAALTDADLAIQNFVEVALLGSFPNLRFYGEEHENSSNTKYFRSIELGSHGDYLVTLDPIDGTQFYLDGHSNYQIILSILNTDDFEAVIAISPSENVYFYALRGEGAFKGKLDLDLEACTSFKIADSQPNILLGWDMSYLAAALKDKYHIIDIGKTYSREMQIPNLNGIFSGDIAGAAIRSGNFIDGASLAFLAREAGCIVTTLDGSSLPPLHTCKNYRLPGLIVATSPSVHQHLVEAGQITVN
ncbi:MAG: inositol monophosphatase family protein [Calothrix sp. MO_167.B12]|nr:inositol monophosphatase family protein [Calothrix sp. MO_167.B12]